MPIISFTPRFSVKATHQEHLNLTLGVELKVTISLEPTLYKFSELLREGRIVQVVHSETGPGCFGRVSWSDTLLGGTDG
jgi:hypothetical protein